MASVRVLCWRDADIPADTIAWKSRFAVLSSRPQSDTPQVGRPSAVGWEKNAQLKMGPRMADLAPMMDPKR
jgi:ubiquitin-like modifier-activating enzyme ATG7